MQLNNSWSKCCQTKMVSMFLLVNYKILMKFIIILIHTTSKTSFSNGQIA